MKLKKTKRLPPYNQSLRKHWLNSGELSQNISQQTIGIFLFQLRSSLSQGSDTLQGNKRVNYGKFVTRHSDWQYNLLFQNFNNICYTRVKSDTKQINVYTGLALVHMVPRVRCGTWLYLFLIFAFIFSLSYTVFPRSITKKHLL